MTLRHVTTEPGVVAEVDVPVNTDTVAVLNYGGPDFVLVRVDGGEPGLEGAAAEVTRVVPPGARRIIDRPESLDGPVEVRLLSAGAVPVELEV